MLASAVNMQMTSQEQKHSLNVNKPPKQSYRTFRKDYTSQCGPPRLKKRDFKMSVMARASKKNWDQ